MRRRDSVSTERGSMLPLFLGLVGLSLALVLGASQVLTGYLFREKVQSFADQLALVSVSQGIESATAAESRLVTLTRQFHLKSYRLTDGKTVELTLCGNLKSWEICAQASAR